MSYYPIHVQLSTTTTTKLENMSKDKKQQSLKTNQLSEPDSDMTWILYLPDRDFNIIMISMFRL